MAGHRVAGNRASPQHREEEELEVGIVEGGSSDLPLTCMKLVLVEICQETCGDALMGAELFFAPRAQHVFLEVARSRPAFAGGDPHGCSGSESCHRTEHQPRDDVRVPKLSGDPAKAALPEERVNSARRVGLHRRAIPADWVRQDARRAEHEGVPITGPIDGVRAVLCGHTILGYRQHSCRNAR